jgi:glycosyltransferase involved in cell wall biosynthesis
MHNEQKFEGNTQMRIAIACQKADMLGGAAKITAVLASSLKKEGFDVACVSLKSPVKGRSFPEFHEIERWYTPRHILPVTLGRGYINTLYYQHHFLLANQLKKCEREFRPDFVINMLAWSGTNVSRKVAAPKIDYIQTWPFDLQVLHQPTFWGRVRMGGLCLKDHHQTLKKLHKVISNSEYTKNRAYNLWSYLLPYEKFAVIHPCVDWKEIQRHKSKIRHKRVCHVGRLCEEKGVDLVIDAFLKADVEESELVIAGSVLQFSPYKEYYIQLKEKLFRLGDKRIRLIKNPSDEEIMGIYNSSRCFVNFNPLEAFGMCVVEAMAAGTPPIVADGGGQKETVIDGITGFRINAESSSISDEMAQYMQLLLTDDRVFNKMSTQARLHAAQFDKSEFVKKWIKIFEST